MALNKNHKTHLDTMAAFETADKNTPRNELGGATYGMGSNGMPRTPAQQASVKKAAQASAMARKSKGKTLGAIPAPASFGLGLGVVKPAKPGISTGSLSIAQPKKGLLAR